MGAAGEAAATTVGDIIKESIPDPDAPTLTGGTQQVNKPGNLDAAYKDFDSLNPSDVQSKDNGVKIGKLSNGNTVIARPLSSPTLEIQDPSGKSIVKVRYKQ